MRRAARAFALAAMLVSAACQVEMIEPVPLRGESPQVVAVWPHVFGGGLPAPHDWFAGLLQSLRARGYGVVAPGVAAELLGSAGFVDTTPDPRVGPLLRADALLELRVRAFDCYSRDDLLQRASWDLEWRLLSTRGAGVQWRYSHQGSWDRSDRGRVDALTRSETIDASGMSLPRPIGGDGRQSFRDEEELLYFLHRDATAHLPRR